MPKIFQKLFTFSCLATFSIFCASIFTTTPAPASAASASGFNPGNIITDYVMSNYTTMSVEDIQTFLKSKNSCNDTNISKAQTYSSYSYHIENGHFVCLADEDFDGKSAAQIIYNAAQTYKINPQVIIVLLQKEQGLITDTWPNSRQYRSATGYGCPDTAACDSKYYGFENQVNNAAALFRTVLDGGWSNYHVGENYIQYSPNSACGGSTVFIQNLATASLYRYTPYQPNAASLAAGYGTGDSCSAYGNRNFYLYFTDWFGSTQIGAPSFSPSIYLPENTTFIISTIGHKFLTADTNNSILTASQGLEFQFTRTSDNFYVITDTASTLALDIDGNAFTDGADVILSTRDSARCSQKWHLARTDGQYTIRSACSGWSLDVYSGLTNSTGANIWLYHHNDSSAQRYLLTATSAAQISEATYYLTTPSGLVLDVAGGTTTDGSNLQTYTLNYSPAQQYKISRTTDGFYVLTGVGSGKVVDVKDASTSNGANVNIYKYNNTCAQLWYATSAAEYYVFHSACSGKVMDVENGSTSPRANVQLWQANSSDAQRWRLTQYETPSSNTSDSTAINSPTSLQDGQTYTIVSAADQSMAIDVANIGTADRTNIQLYQKWGTNNPAQTWKITTNSDGSVTFTNPNSGKVLDLSGGQPTNYANIQIYHSNNTCAQKWQPVQTDSGAYLFLSTCNPSWALDLANASTAAGTNIQLYQKWGDANLAQQWYLVNN